MLGLQACAGMVGFLHRSFIFKKIKVVNINFSNYIFTNGILLGQDNSYLEFKLVFSVRRVVRALVL